MRSEVKFQKKMACQSLAVLAVAAAALRPTFSSAVTISEYYIDGQIATDPNFTTGVQNVDLSGSSPSVTIPDGDYFQFGVALVLTGNPNPASGDAWDLANQAKGNPAQPQNLGISNVVFDVLSSDVNGFVVAAVHGPIEADAPANETIFQSTAVINPNLNVNFASPGNAGGGEVGYIEVGNAVNINPSTSAVDELGYFAGAAATPDQATPLFTDLAFQVKSAGQVELSPGIALDEVSTGALVYWTNHAPGSVAPNGTLKSAIYSPTNELTTSDTINALPTITINGSPIQSVLSLSSSPPTTYGDEVPLFGPPPFERLPLNIFASSTIQETRFYFAAPDLDPTSPYLTVYLDLAPSANATEIAQFVGDLNNNDAGIIAASGPILDGFSFSGYNILLQIPQADFAQTNGVAYLGFDMSQISDIPDIQDLYIRQVLVLPEPGSAGLLTAGAIALIGRRKRR
jgi:hypothetical protein